MYEKEIEKYIRKFCCVGSVYASLNEAVDKEEKDSYRIELYEIKELAKQLLSLITKARKEAVEGFGMFWGNELKHDAIKYNTIFSIEDVDHLLDIKISQYLKETNNV